MNKPSALLAAIAFFVALAFVASCGQPEPWEPPADREARAIDRLRYLLEPSEAHAQLFPSTLTDTLRLGKGRYRLIQVESAQNLLVEKFYLGPTYYAAQLQRGPLWPFPHQRQPAGQPIATPRHGCPSAACCGRLRRPRAATASPCASTRIATTTCSIAVWAPRGRRWPMTRMATASPTP